VTAKREPVKKGKEKKTEYMFSIIKTKSWWFSCKKEEELVYL
jgi:hypothetical protein